MIPPVEVRQVRPCDVCMLCIDTDRGEYCELEIEIYSKRENTIRSRISDATINSPNQWINPEDRSRIIELVMFEFPCQYNLKSDEYRELIDSGAV